MFLSQLLLPDGTRAVALRQRAEPSWVPAHTTRDLALAAIAAQRSLLAEIAARGPRSLGRSGGGLDAGPAAFAAGPSRSGASAPDRDRADASRLGRDAQCHACQAGRRRPDRQHEDVPHGAGGRQARPGPDRRSPNGSQGNGHAATAPGAALWTARASRWTRAKKPEIAGLYLIGPDGTPFRLGFALGNEFSDHVTERGNYLWLAHSKLRPASFGPELRLGDLPQHVEGTSRLITTAR